MPCRKPPLYWPQPGGRGDDGSSGGCGCSPDGPSCVCGGSSAGPSLLLLPLLWPALDASFGGLRASLDGPRGGCGDPSGGLLPLLLLPLRPDVGGSSAGWRSSLDVPWGGCGDSSGGCLPLPPPPLWPALAGSSCALSPTEWLFPAWRSACSASCEGQSPSCLAPVDLPHGDLSTAVPPVWTTTASSLAAVRCRQAGSTTRDISECLKAAVR
mmetsp:Transcript_65500/g.206995  ORF Transcript_65500/g.206995 Transcript_65500/m.206995 type:complete len:212 (-) Transcript_65500:71-706(-)